MNSCLAVVGRFFLSYIVGCYLQYSVCVFQLFCFALLRVGEGELGTISFPLPRIFSLENYSGAFVTPFPFLLYIFSRLCDSNNRRRRRLFSSFSSIFCEFFKRLAQDGSSFGKFKFDYSLLSLVTVFSPNNILLLHLILFNAYAIFSQVGDDEDIVE